MGRDGLAEDGGGTGREEVVRDDVEGVDAGRAKNGKVDADALVGREPGEVGAARAMISSPTSSSDEPRTKGVGGDTGN